MDVYAPDVKKIQALLARTGYALNINHEERIYGRPSSKWAKPTPPSGHELFCGKLPRFIYEDTLVPLFEIFGIVWSLTLAMDPDLGRNRGFCYVIYEKLQDAQNALNHLRNFEIVPGWTIKVNPSHTRLYLGNLPQIQSGLEIQKRMKDSFGGIIQVTTFHPPFDPEVLNEGFAYVDFDCHRSASIAQKALSTGAVLLWNHRVNCLFMKLDDLIKEDEIDFTCYTPHPHDCGILFEEFIEEKCQIMDHGDVDSSLPIGDVDSSLPIGDVDSSLPIGDVDSSLPIGDVDSSLPIGDVDPSLPIGDAIEIAYYRFFNSRSYKHVTGKIIPHKRQLKYFAKQLQANSNLKSFIPDIPIFLKTWIKRIKVQASVGIIVRSKSLRFLLVKSVGGKFGHPKGRLMFGELPVIGACREVHEETPFKNIYPFLIDHHVMFTSSGRLTFLFVADGVEELPVPITEEIEAYM